MSLTINIASLRGVLPADIISRIYEYDNTYHEKYKEMLYSNELAKSLWNRWKRQLFAQKTFIDSPILKEKCEFLLEYLCFHTFMFTDTFEYPINANVFIKEKLFYYSNGQENKERAAELFLRNPNIEPGTFELSFEFLGGIFANFRFIVLTKEQYYYRYVNTEEDRNYNEYCFYSKNNFYLVENRENMYLSQIEAIV